MPSSWANQKITRKRYPTVNDMGSTVVDYTAQPDDDDIDGCVLEPAEPIGNEATDDSDQVLTTNAWRVAAPFAADVLARDVIVFNGVDYIATEDAQKVTSPTGRLNQALFTIKKRGRNGIPSPDPD